MAVLDTPIPLSPFYCITKTNHKAIFHCTTTKQKKLTDIILTTKNTMYTEFKLIILKLDSKTKVNERKRQRHQVIVIPNTKKSSLTSDDSTTSICMYFILSQLMNSIM